ncbi:MAG: 7-carboxy-7-deazaguanine synthase QueE [Endomicrobiia bacterium]
MNIKEIFFSYQGEAKYIGYPTLFVRFAGCNLNCFYCDTKKAKKVNFKDKKDIDEVLKIIDMFVKKYKPKFISFTGGEPLIQDENELVNFLQRIKKYNTKIYLETNATLPKKLIKIIKFLDVISVNLKLPIDDVKNFDTFKLVKRSIDLCKMFNKEFFVKIVITKNYYEKKLIIKIKKFLNETKPDLLILQPETTYFKKANKNIFLNLCNLYSQIKNAVSYIHIIPQLHRVVWRIK